MEEKLGDGERLEENLPISRSMRESRGKMSLSEGIDEGGDNWS